MFKPIFLLTISLFFCRGAFAQKRDTSVYYLNNSGKVVSSKDSADYFLVILPPDINADKNLFIVKEFYKDGKIRLIGSTTSKSLDFVFQGSQITFFPNGHKMRITQFKKGEPIDDVIEYYPNGKLYNIKSYPRNKKIFLKQCNDSTGNVLAQNGDGKWLDFFDETFKENYAEGVVKNGLQEGGWHGRINGIDNYVWVYQKGELIASYSGNQYKGAQTKNESVPEFPGGLESFILFIHNNVHYPNAA
jgi:MORN repeat variant